MPGGSPPTVGAVKSRRQEFPWNTPGMDAQPGEWQQPLILPPQAWRDGDELVVRIGAPLPPICVFCGAPAVAGIRNAINTRGHPIGNLQILTTRIPVCDDDRRRHRYTMIRMNGTVVVVFVVALLTGILPGWLGLFAINPYGGTLPGVRVIVVALALFVGSRVVRARMRASAPVPRPVRLRFDRGQDGYVWLRDADPRCLSQLPPVAPGR
jgi:hypothetical protein